MLKLVITGLAVYFVGKGYVLSIFDKFYFNKSNKDKK